MASKNKKGESSIDKSLQKLKKLVKKFEEGEIGIDKGIEEYEKASGLIKSIKKELSKREVKIEEIKKDYSS